MRKCTDELQRFNFVEYKRKEAEFQKTRKSIESANNQLKVLDDALVNDRKALSSIAGKTRLPRVSRIVSSTLARLSEIRDEASIPIRAELSSLKLKFEPLQKYHQDHFETGKLIEQRFAEWEQWKSDPKLDVDSNVNYGLVPYPENEDLARFYLCAACGEDVLVVNVDAPEISIHSDPASGKPCLNSTVKLERNDLCTISGNCQITKMKISSEIQAVNLDHTKFGEPVILPDGSVVSYGSRQHVDALNNNEKPERPY